LGHSYFSLFENLALPAVHTGSLPKHPYPSVAAFRE
jgi:hypothetical protein